MRDLAKASKATPSGMGLHYGTFLTATMLSEAILPSLFKQDPRYFYKGAGSSKSRFFYAVSRPIIRKGDNGEWHSATRKKP